MNKVSAARAGIPAAERAAYLNTANIGPITRAGAEKLAAATTSDLLNGRAVEARWHAIEGAAEALRREIALLLGCDAGNILLTNSTSDGLRRVIDSLPWSSGDETLSTSIEHGTCVELLEKLTLRHGVVRRVASLPAESAANIDWLTGQLSPKTKLVAVSAVAFETGSGLPVEAITAAARAAGVPVLLDAAQCAGASPLDVAAIDPDYCALPLRKWLCGPEGLGALYVRAPDANARLYETAGSLPYGRGIFEAAVAGMAWLREALGWSWIFERTRALALYTRNAVADRDDMVVLGNAPFAGITTIRCTAAAAPGAAGLLADKGFLVRQLTDLSAFRVSTAFFNTEQEIDSLIATLAAMQSSHRHRDRQ